MRPTRLQRLTRLWLHLVSALLLVAMLLSPLL